MRKKQFKAESKRLLDLMINSIYTNKEIFLRELISNASDAEDKLYYKALTDTSLNIDRDDFKIEVILDKTNRTLTIKDNGIGMNKRELETYLGTIAKSDSFDFKNVEEEPEVDIIGQFGVGFYSAFMVADKIEVISRSYLEDTASIFTSSGIEGYTIDESTRDSHGTTIIAHIKENTDDVNYDIYLERYHIENLIKRYSDYIRYPIILTSTVEEDIGELKKGELKVETVNSMIPLWKRSKQDLNEEDLNTFYKSKFADFENPLKSIHMHVEGMTTFDALMFIPTHVPMNFYSAQYEVGLELYSRGVFIMEHNKALLPDYFRFVKGLVDSSDLNLNISREILQDDPKLRNIASRIERKIQSELELMLRNDRENYETFWNNFGLSIKYGVYDNFGMNKDKLQDLLMFHSSKENKLVTLKEYVENMKEDQKEIYYVSGESISKLEKLPQTEYVLSKGFEILYLTDEIDEFALQVLHSYDEKHFKNISQGDLDLMDESQKEDLKEKETEAEDLLTSLKESLKDKVSDVRLSSRLVTHPVVLVSDDGLSFEMEKVLAQLQEEGEAPKATRILEINPKHELLDSLQRIYDNNPESLSQYADLLFDQASLIEGYPIEDPVQFSQNMANLMIEVSKLK